MLGKIFFVLYLNPVIKQLTIFWILMGGCISSITAQVNCDITTPNLVKICKAGSVTLNVEGNTQDVQWTDGTGKIISTNTTLTKEISATSTFHVINKIPFGNELILNGDFENGTNDFTSSYSVSCVQGTMPQGSFCITDNSGWFHAGWSNCTTRSNSGEMMVSDGAIKANEAIWCQTVPVEQNKDYAFSAWLTPVIGTAPPIMQFSINGILLGEPFESNDSPCDWQEFFEIWNSDLSTSAEICIVNQNTTSLGNDFALDNISLRETCFDKETVTVQIVDSIEVDLGPDTTFCAGDEMLLKNWNENAHAQLSYNWSTGETSAQIIVTEPTNYLLTVTSPEGCEGKDTIFFTDLGYPSNTLPSDTNICFIAYDNVVFQTGEALNTLWTHNGISDTSSKYHVFEAGIYDLVLSNGENCTIRDQIIIEDECSKNLYLPNAFTPNSDGKNDTFGPESIETYSYEFLIFNRWGEVVFEGKDVHDHWNGKYKNHRAPAGVYTYFISYTIVGFYSNRIEKITKAGHFSLLR